jgi:hypothetical protein
VFDQHVSRKSITAPRAHQEEGRMRRMEMKNLEKKRGFHSTPTRICGVVKMERGGESCFLSCNGNDAIQMSLSGGMSRTGKGSAVFCYLYLDLLLRASPTSMTPLICYRRHKKKKPDGTATSLMMSSQVKYW